MSSSPRRKSHNSIQKSVRPRSKSKNIKKRYSTNTIRSSHPHSHTAHPPRYSHHGIQPSPHKSPNGNPFVGQYNNNGYSPYNGSNTAGYHPMLDDINNDYEESPEPPIHSKPTHKKNAVSSFLSIFSGFSQSKVRRTNSNNNDIESMSDLEVLKRMKRRILDILSKMLDSKKLKKIKSELKSEVWDVEYSELKKRLGAHDIHTATIRQKFSTAKSLKQLTSIQSLENDEDDQDVREMATFLLSEYFDQPTVPVSTPNTKDNNNNNNKPTPLVIPDTIKERAAGHLSDIRTSQTDVDDAKSDNSFFSEHSESFSDHNNLDEDDEKKIKMDVNYSPFSVDNNNNNNNSPQQNGKQSESKKNGKNDNHSKTHRKSHKKRHKKRKSKKRKYKQRKSEINKIQMDGNMSDGAVRDVLNQRRASKSGHKYSPRPISPLPKAYSIITYPTITNTNNNMEDNKNDNDNDDDDDILNISPKNNNIQKNMDKEKDEDTQRRTKEHRFEIRSKFRRGVRKAMLVNAWTGITAQTDKCNINNNNNQSKKRLSLSLSDEFKNNFDDINDGVIDIINGDIININNKSKTKSPSYSTPFMSFMSDNLMLALSKVGTWEFDPFEFFDTPEIGGKGLVYSVWYLCDKYDLFKIFPSISPKKFMRFLTLVEDGYLDNPYHNKIHATDVVSNVAYYLNNASFFKKHISAFDNFTAIISAAVHDLGHDGNNNAYHITTMSDLAITYNDISVLENYHIASTFKILKRADCNWYSSLTKPIQKYLRLSMIDIVLATDMKYHNKKLASLTGLVAILKQQLNKKILLRDDRDSIASTHSIPLSPNHLLTNIRRNGSQSSLISDKYEFNSDLKEKEHSISMSHTNTTTTKESPLLDPTYNIKPKTLADFPLYKYKVNEVGVEHLLKTIVEDVIMDDTDSRVVDVLNERRFILCWLVHLCDISNCAKSLVSGKKWAVRVMTEFFKQGDRERALGLEVSAMMDRRRSSTPQGQIGFIKFILRPSYNMFARLVPEANKPLEILNENLEYWEVQQKLMTQERKKRAKSLGSIQSTPVLMLMQDQLKKLNMTRVASDDDIIRSEIMDDNIDDDDDGNSQKSVEIRSVDEDNPNMINRSQIEQNPTKQRGSNKHVGFKDILVIERHDSNSKGSIGNGSNGNGSNKLHHKSSSSFINIINDDESDITAITPRSVDQTKLMHSASHHIQASSSSNQSTKSGRSRNGNYSIDSNSLDAPLSGGKLRAHSIHVSIPTSEKQLQSQPQPFTEFLAELRKEYNERQQEEEKQQQQKQKKKRRRERTNEMKGKSDTLHIIKKKENSPRVPKVSQSVSLPVGLTDDTALGATISIDISDKKSFNDNKSENIDNISNSNGNDNHNDNVNDDNNNHTNNKPNFVNTVVSNNTVGSNKKHDVV